MPLTDEELKAVWSRETTKSIAAQSGETLGAVYSRARRLGLPPRRALRDEMPTEDDGYLPTPEEIREGCRRARKNWSPADWAARRVGWSRGAYTIPEVSVVGPREAPSFAALQRR